MLLKNKIMIACCLLVGLTLLSCVLIRVCSPSRSPIVYLNMKAVIADPTAKLVKSFPAHSASMMSAYMNALPFVIADYARDHHVMIVSAVVLAGSDQRDITPDIMQAALAKVSE